MPRHVVWQPCLQAHPVHDVWDGVQDVDDGPSRRFVLSDLRDDDGRRRPGEQGRRGRMSRFPVRLVKLGQCGHEMCYACRAKQLHAKATIEDGMDQFASCPMCRAPNNQAIDPQNPYEHLREAARAQWELRENRAVPEGSFAEYK